MARITDGNRQNIIGEKIKTLRLNKGLSQKELSEKLETFAVYICRGSISRIESGERTVTDIEIVGFANSLETTIEDLFSNK